MDRTRAPARRSRAGTSRAVKFAMRGSGGAVVAIAATAFLGGLLEALFLITVTRSAFAISSGRDRVGLLSSWSLPVEHTLGIGVALVVLRMVLAGYTSWRSADVSSRVMAGIRERLTGAFLESSWELQQAQRSGSLQELLTTYSERTSSLTGYTTTFVVMGANLVALLGMAFAVNALGAVLMAVSVAVLGLLLRPVRSLVRRRARPWTKASMDLAVSVNEVSELGLELHVFHVQDKAQARIREAIEQVRKTGISLQFATGLSTPLYMALAYLAIIGALAVVTASSAGSLTSLSATMLVMLRSLGYGQGAQGAYVNVSGAVPAIEELEYRLQTFESGRRMDQGQDIDQVGAVSMEGVSFAYPGGEAVLRNISFTIAAHEVVGIVGPSGAGKSTLVQLVLGLRDPDQGRILADGRDISSFDRAQWARKVTFVPQAAHLIAGTIADNIRFFREGVSDEDIERAARLAHLHEDVQGWPEGYERQVGKHGGHLSGGQQQRLCIARALVEHPDVLILDEPTSALDVRSEHLVRNMLQTLKDRMTVIVIAHRLSTLSICDRIMVIKDGELKEFDTPSVLEQSSDFYREALVLSGMR